MELTRADIESLYVPFGKHRGDALPDVPAPYLEWLLSSADHPWVHTNRTAIRAALALKVTDCQAAAPPIVITPHQQAAVDALMTLVDAGQRVLRLQGAAGYGKSYTVKALLKTLADRGYIAHACATSYVATQVLARDLEPYGYTAATIARTFKMTKQFADGEETYSLTVDSHLAISELLAEGRVLVIDEASMVHDDIATPVLEQAARSQGILLLVGDEAQLPPVKQDAPSIFCATEHVVELTEPMRYARGSHLHQIERAARHDPYSLPLHNSEQTFVATRGSDVFTAFAENYAADPDATHRMLLYRRYDVVRANNYARSMLFGDDAAVLTDGEKLLVLRTSDYPYEERPMPGDTTRFYSGEVYCATSISDSVYEITIGDRAFLIPHYIAQLGSKVVNLIFAISETQADAEQLGGLEFNAAIQAAFAHGKSTKQWGAYRKLLGDFVSVGYNYATSVHRAQGQTFDYVYCMPSQLLAVPGRIGLALTYVGLTRARKRMTVRA